MDSPSPKSYRLYPIRDPEVTEVVPDAGRTFLVVSGTRSRTGEPWTMVLERQQDYWISRRDLTVPFDAATAVSGFLFSRQGYDDPLELLRRMNESVRVEYYRVLQDKIRGDRARAELVDEVARLKGECEELKQSLRRKAGRGETTGRRSPAAPRKRSSARRRR